jgi:hypothetical protein
MGSWDADDTMAVAAGHCIDANRKTCPLLPGNKGPVGRGTGE